MISGEDEGGNERDTHILASSSETISGARCNRVSNTTFQGGQPFQEGFTHSHSHRETVEIVKNYQSSFFYRYTRTSRWVRWHPAWFSLPWPNAILSSSSVYKKNNCLLWWSLSSRWTQKPLMNNMTYYYYYYFSYSLLVNKMKQTKSRCLITNSVLSFMSQNHHLNRKTPPY